ncbi:MAG: LysR family transcriptional regulator [Pelagimonas sp.]|uniref:LysR family transcriptional regulator n=1 Tax=Pelagimonas sp. TaxID=2073170 RepID=UPI003D6A5175
MTQALPTLKGLRAFEEAYRLRSFTAAAKSLNVQQPAISYQIKRLEEDLGVVLFDKRQGRPVPTGQAHELFDTLSRAFDAIRQTSNDLRQSAQMPSFTIATYPGIGTYWLSPRLPILSEEMNINTKLITVKKDADLWGENADCWIVFGRGNWAGFDAELLILEEVCPVAAPGLAGRVSSQDPFDWPKGARIIEQDDPENRWLCWNDWCRKQRQKQPPAAQRISVNDHGLALHMALAGQGVALAWLGIVDDLLASKSLIRMSPHVLTSGAGYWLVGRPGFFETTRGELVLRYLKGSNEV